MVPLVCCDKVISFLYVTWRDFPWFLGETLHQEKKI